MLTVSGTIRQTDVVKAVRLGRSGKIVSAAVLVAGMSLLPPSSARADTAEVEILDFGYLAADFVVAVGDQVKWVNTGATAHTVTADDGVVDRFDSGKLQPGAAFVRAFRSVGTFAYHCAIYRSMRATVHVTQDRAAASRYRRIPLRPAAAGPAPPSAPPPSSPAPGTPRSEPKPAEPASRREPVAPRPNSGAIQPLPPLDVALRAPTTVSAPPVSGPSSPVSEASPPEEPAGRHHAGGSEALVGKFLVVAGGVLLLANLRRRAPS